MNIWLKYINGVFIFPILVGMYTTLNKRISNKVNKDVFAMEQQHNKECLIRHEKLLNKIYAKVEETNINVAKLTVKN